MIVDFNLNQRVSSQLAFLLVLVLSFVLAWYSINTAQEITRNAKDSEAFNANVRLERSEVKAGNQRIK